MNCEWADHFGHRCGRTVLEVVVSKKVGRHSRESVHCLCENAVRDAESRGYEVRIVNIETEKQAAET